MLSNSSADMWLNPLGKRKPSEYSSTVILKKVFKSLFKEFCTITRHFEKELIWPCILWVIIFCLCYSLSKTVKMMSESPPQVQKYQTMKRFSVTLGNEKYIKTHHLAVQINTLSFLGTVWETSGTLNISSSITCIFTHGEQTCKIMIKTLPMF